MSKPVLEAVERLVDVLSPQEKLRICEKLEGETQVQRLDALLKRIRLQTARRPISERRLQQLCDEVRQELYEERTQGHR